MSHPYHRAKVDLNAQQHYISGGILECDNPKLACVICEGGPKAIQRFSRLMLVRMKWTGPDDAEEDDDEVEDDVSDLDNDADQVMQKFNPDNKCELVWQGMVVKRLFKGFTFQTCETSDQARKILKAKGVEHYWDQVLALTQGERKGGIRLKLTSTDSDEDENPYAGQDEDDIIMAEEN
jgi:U4/U6 small nuclear ribonucleoprotein PRP3